MVIRVFDEVRHICLNCKHWENEECNSIYSLMFKKKREFNAKCPEWEHEQKFTTSLDAIRSARQ